MEYGEYGKLFGLLADLEGCMTRNPRRNFSGNEDEYFSHTLRDIRLEGWCTEENGSDNPEMTLLIDGNVFTSIPIPGLQQLDFTGTGIMEDKVPLAKSIVDIIMSINSECCRLFITPKFNCRYIAVDEVQRLDRERAELPGFNGSDLEPYDIVIKPGEQDSFGVVTWIMTCCFGTFLIA